MRSDRKKWLFAVAAGAALFAGQPAANASLTVAPGWDLLHTVSAQFMGQDWEGVPIGNFDFGAPIGVQNVDGVDTIVRRLTPANAPVDLIPIEFVALQLVSVNPFDPGAGLDTYYITLQQSTPSLGMATISFEFPEPPPALPYLPHGTFTLDFTIAYEVHKGSLAGPLFGQGSLDMSTVGAGYWAHVPLPGHGPEIPGVNTFLNGTDREEDFWLALSPAGESQVGEAHSGGAGTHVVDNPEPQEWAMLGGLGLIGFAAYRKIAARRSA